MKVRFVVEKVFPAEPGWETVHAHVVYPHGMITEGNLEFKQPAGQWCVNQTFTVGLFEDEPQNILRHVEKGNDPIFGSLPPRMGENRITEEGVREYWDGKRWRPLRNGPDDPPLLAFI